MGKFGQTLRQQIIKEWAFYAVDYKAMKKTLNAQGIIDGKVDHAEFDRLFELSQKKLRKFYEDKESWAKDYIHVLEERVEALRESHTASMTEAFPENSSPENETDSENEESSTHSPTGREWVESVMPVHFVPRTESCSSTLLRTIYHADDEELRIKAAFAKTRYDGKPVDEDGNV